MLIPEEPKALEAILTVRPGGSLCGRMVSIDGQGVAGYVRAGGLGAGFGEFYWVDAALIECFRSTAKPAAR